MKSKRRRQVQVQDAAVLIPFSAQQRSVLLGQLVFCGISALILFAVACFFLGLSLDPRAQSGSLLWLPVLVAGGFLVIICIFGLQYLRDWQSGGVLQRRVRLEQVLRRNLYRPPIGYVFAEIGEIKTPIQRDIMVSIHEDEIGKRLLITYSPHSRVIWSARPVG